MILKKGEKEIELNYTISGFSRLKKELRCKNLRNTLLKALRDGDYETLCKAVSHFSGGKLSLPEVQAVVDTYKAEHSCSYYDLFLTFLEEVEEAGFFADKKTGEELRELAASPMLEVDLDSLVEEAVGKLASSELMENIAAMRTGETTSPTSGQPVISPA